jgi:hypothetical protein
VENADDGNICGENAEANRGDDGGEENDGHNERIHGNQPLTQGSYQMHGSEIRIPDFFLRFSPASSGAFKASQIYPR